MGNKNFKIYITITLQCQKFDKVRVNLKTKIAAQTLIKKQRLKFSGGPFRAV